MSVIIIDAETKDRVKQVREYARKHRFSIGHMKEIIDGVAETPGENENFVVHFPGTGLRMVLSLEEQPKGLMWHVSISIPKPNAHISPRMVDLLFDTLQLDRHAVVATWLEPYGRENTAFNILVMATGSDSVEA